MKKLPIIKNKQLKKAINKYFEIKAVHQGLIHEDQKAEFDNACTNIFTAAAAENKSCAIAPGLIVLTEKMAFKRQRSGWIRSKSRSFTADWEMTDRI